MQIKKQDANIHGVVVVYKPQGFTSFDVIAKLKGILQTRKIGHSGTLDPMATGVLPVFVGRATKAVDMQTNHDKTYLATVQFGIKTDTGDRTGTVLETSDKTITAQILQDVLPQFVGTQLQTPPMYSAVKVNGQPLYKLARQGKEVARKAKEITIYELAYKGQVAENRFLLEVVCSKGTYVRTLLEEIGDAIGCPATMQELERTQAGNYTLAQAVTLEMLQEAKDNGSLQQLLTPVSTVFAGYLILQADDDMVAALQNGLRIAIAQPDGRYAVWQGAVFLGVADVADHVLKVVKLFIDRA